MPAFPGNICRKAAMAGMLPFSELFLHLFLILSFPFFCVDGLPNTEVNMKIQQKTWRKVSPSDCSKDNNQGENFLLCIIAMPWCGTSQRFMHDVEKLINTGNTGIRNLDLCWVDSHKEKEHLKLNDNDVLPILNFVGKGSEWKYDSVLSANAVLQAARYLFKLKDQEFPLREYKTLEDIRSMIEPAIRAFVIVDNCGWSKEILNRETDIRKDSCLETQLTINESLPENGGQGTGVAEEIKVDIGERREEGSNLARKNMQDGGLEGERELIGQKCMVGHKNCNDFLGQTASFLPKVTSNKDKEGYEGECKDVQEREGSLDIRVDANKGRDVEELPFVGNDPGQRECQKIEEIDNHKGRKEYEIENEIESRSVDTVFVTDSLEAGDKGVYGKVTAASSVIEEVRKDRDLVGEKNVMGNHIEDVKVGETEQSKAGKIKSGEINSGESTVDSNVLASGVQIEQDLSIGTDCQSGNEAEKGKPESNGTEERAKDKEYVDPSPKIEQVSNTFRIFNRRTGKGDPKGRYSCTRLQKSKFMKAFESLRQDAITSIFTPWLASYGIVRNGSILVDIDSRLKDLPWAFLVHSMDVEPEFFVLPGGEANVWDWSHKLPRPPLGLLIPEDYITVFQEEKPTVILFLDKTSPLPMANQELVFSEFRKVARHYADIARIEDRAAKLKYDFEQRKKSRSKTTGNSVDMTRLISKIEKPGKKIVLAKEKRAPIEMERQVLSPALALAGQLGLEMQLLNIDLSLGQNAVVSLLQTLLNSGQLRSIEIDNNLKTTIEASEGRNQQLLALAQKQTTFDKNSKKLEEIEEIEEYRGNSLAETSKKYVVEMKADGSEEEDASKFHEGVESTLNIAGKIDQSNVLDKRGDKVRGEREEVTNPMEEGEPEASIHRTEVKEETDFMEVKSLEEVGNFVEGQGQEEVKEAQMRPDEEKGEDNKKGGERGLMDGKDESEREAQRRISMDGNGEGEDEHESQRNTERGKEEEEETQEPPNDSSTGAINFFFMAGETILPEKLLLGNDFPSLSLIHPVKKEHFAFPQNLKMTKETIIGFIEAVLSGKVVKTMRSSSPPKPPPPPPPTPLITKTFQRPGRVASVSLFFFAELVLGRTCGKKAEIITNNDTESDTGSNVGLDSQKLTELDIEREDIEREGIHGDENGKIPSSTAIMREEGETNSVPDVGLTEKNLRPISTSEKSKNCVNFSGAMSGNNVETCSWENENKTKWENENKTKWENEVFCEDNGAEGRDVVVLYTTSWCGFCLRMELVYEEVQKVLTHYSVKFLSGFLPILDRQLAYGVPLTEHKDVSPRNTKETQKSYQKRGNKRARHCNFVDEFKEKGNDGRRGKSKQKEVPLLFRMDCTANDCSGTGEGRFQVTEYPTVVLYPAHRKDEPVFYTGPPTVKRLLAFLGWRSDKHRQNGKEDVSKKGQKGQSLRPYGNKKLSKSGHQRSHQSATFSSEGDKISVATSPVLYGKETPNKNEELRTFENSGGKNRCKILTTLMPGSLLVASEQLDNSELFGKSVILVLEAVDNPLGVILNHRLEWNQIAGLKEDVKRFLKGSFIGLGGPIMAEVAVPSVILTRRMALPGFSKILGPSALYWGSNLDAFKVVLDLITRKVAKPEEFWFFIGFSSWTNSQLIAEVAMGTWYPTECSFDLSGFLGNMHIGKDYDLWDNILKHLGKNPESLL